MKLKSRRLPSYPIFVKDPYFSLWLNGDVANGCDTVFWHGEKKPMKGTLTTLREVELIEYNYSVLSEEEQTDVTHYTAYQEIKADKLMNVQEVEKVPNKVIYFNHKAGLSQISWMWREDKAIITDELTYLDEAVMKISVNEGDGDIAFSLSQPYIYDLSEYGYVKFAVYHTYSRDLIYYNSDNTFKNIGESSEIKLQPDTWNVIKLSLGDFTNIKDSVFWIIKDGWINFTEDVDFYISSIYAHRSTDGIAFDQPDGCEKLTAVDNATASYSDEMCYGAEIGSTKITTAITANGYQLYMDINEPTTKTVQPSNTFTMYVYYGGGNDYAFSVLEKGWYGDEELICEISLTKSTWTEITFTIPDGRRLSEYSIMIRNTNWIFQKGDAVYLSSLNLVAE